MAHPRGRQSIGFNQSPSGGSSYPFVSPSSDIDQLLGDFFLSFDDVNDKFSFPFRVAWLYGFGSNPVSPIPGYPTPVHTHDIVVVDALGQTVFDSTTAENFNSEVWDDRLLILEWQLTDKVLRCTAHTDWSSADIIQGRTQTYDNYIAPESSELQQDTYYKIPKRVTSLLVGLQRIKGTKVTVQAGYNFDIALVEDEEITDLILDPEDEFELAGAIEEVSPTRRSSSITLAAEAGSGLGLFSACTEEEIVIRTLNGVGANIYNNFVLDGEGCIRYHRPISLSPTATDSRVFSYAAFGLTTSQAASALSLENDCKNCCDCSYFARTYQGIKRQWFLYKDIADAAKVTRDKLSSDIARWEQQKSIREKSTLRLALRPDGDGKVTWGLAFCNATSCCLQDIKIRLTWLPYLNGELTPPEKRPFSCIATQVEGSGSCEGSTSAKMAERAKGTVHTLFVDFADPQSVTTVTGRICFPDATTVDEGSFRLKLHVMVWVKNKITTDDQPCSPQFTQTYDPDVLNWWTSYDVPAPNKLQAQALSVVYDVDKQGSFCQTCECE